MRAVKDVDEYIANASVCTQPILVKLRRLFRQASPKLEETIKWNVPCYVYKGPVGGMAAYKKHVTWGLWKASLLNNADGIIGNDILKGGKITKLSEMPSATKLINLIRQAVALNEAGIKTITPEPEAPADFAAALKENNTAAHHYAAFTPARQWQYVNWITKAKRSETRAGRIKTAIERIGKGKPMK